MIKRRVDLGPSSMNRVIFYEDIISRITSKLTPYSCLEVLKYVAEDRNAALQGPDKEKRAKYKLRDSFYIRDVLADMGWMMQVLRRKFNGTLPPDYECCQL